ncbi:hypothetical protein [Glaesserella parasuis]|uniref:Uncharacterized protein n=1 Tax=Glaesserella parasuis TaxID=738 RepID=A0A859IH44_GLAPU|nr:hypothetical protein [Glaesserella parasuis]QKY73292.1 hypothetical protein FLK62_08620 [Glaesserella parasuis]
MKGLIKLRFISKLDNGELAVSPLFIRKEWIFCIGYYCGNPIPIIPDDLSAYEDKIITAKHKENSSLIFVNDYALGFIRGALQYPEYQLMDNGASFIVYESPEEIMALMKE